LNVYDVRNIPFLSLLSRVNFKFGHFIPGWRKIADDLVKWGGKVLKIRWKGVGLSMGWKIRGVIPPLSIDGKGSKKRSGRMIPRFGGEPI